MRVEQTLAELADLYAPESLLVLDYGDPQLDTDIHPLAGARRSARWVRRRGEPYRTGFTPEELTNALSPNGFIVGDHARVPEMARRYAPNGRLWCSVGTSVFESRDPTDDRHDHQTLDYLRRKWLLTAR